MMNDGIVGQHIWFLRGEEQRIGQITLAIGAEHFLVRLRDGGYPPCNEVLSLGDLAGVLLFDTREELDNFRAWCAEDRPPLRLVRRTSPPDDNGAA
jgi:hypothetical protein